MTYREYLEKVEEIKEERFYDFDEFGIRFENKDRQEGEVITDCSRSNEDREDEREFPEYGTEEYEDLEELDGVCAWNVNGSWGWADSSADEEEEASSLFVGTHCYILGVIGYCEDGEDENEIIMNRPTVLAKLW